MMRPVRIRLLAVLCIALTYLGAYGQTPQFYMEYYTTSPQYLSISSPLGTTFSTKMQCLYKPATDFTTPLPSGPITRLWLRTDFMVTSTSFTNLTIKLGHTTLTSFGSGTTSYPFLTDMTTVYNNPGLTTFAGLTGGSWFYIDLQTPFDYVAGNNLVLEISQAGYTNDGLTLRQTPNSAGTPRMISGNVSATSGNRTARALFVGFNMNITVPVTSVAVTTQGSVPAAISTNAGTLQLQATVAPSAANSAVTWSIQNGAGIAAVNASGLVTALSNGTVTVRATSVQDATKFADIEITVTNQIPAVASVEVTTQGNVPTTITTDSGTLQLEAGILPAGAGQAVTWSVQSGNGIATVSATGMVTALTNGSITIRATSVQDPTKYDDITITVSNQIIEVTSISVMTQGNVPATITANDGTLQLIALLLPAGAEQGVTWSVQSGAGTATVSTTGLVTAIANGSVTIRATSVQDATKFNEITVTMTNQVIEATSVTVVTQGNVPSLITINDGTLQLIATVLPSGAEQGVNWSVQSGNVIVSATGLVTAVDNGLATIRATSVQDVSKFAEIQVTITNQVIEVVSVEVSTQGAVPAAITVNDGTLQLIAEVLPATAVQGVTWTVQSGTEIVSVDTNGLVSALGDGTATIRAVSAQDATKFDDIQITVSNQIIAVATVEVSTEGNVGPTISTQAGTLQLEATVLPENANSAVTWSIVQGNSFATVNANGLVSALADGIAVIRATSDQDNSLYDEIEVTITNQDTAGLGEANLFKVQVYPCPTEGMLTIDFTGNLLVGDTTTADFVNLMGQKVKAVQLSSGVNSIDISELSAGTYFVNLSHAAGTHIIKVIKR